MTNLSRLGTVFLERSPSIPPESAEDGTADPDYYFFRLFASFANRKVSGFYHLLFGQIAVLYFIETVQTVLRHDGHLIRLVFPMVHMIQRKGNTLIEQFVSADSDVTGEVVNFVQQIHIDPHRNHVLFDFLWLFRNKICHIANLPEMIHLW